MKAKELAEKLMKNPDMDVMLIQGKDEDGFPNHEPVKRVHFDVGESHNWVVIT